jgi:hypothetical protein
MNEATDQSARKRRAAREKRRKGILRKLRDFPSKLVSSRFNAYQAVMAVVIAYVAFKVIEKFFP